MISKVIYPEPIESAIAQLESWWQNLGVGAASSKENRYLFGNYSLSQRSLALLLLQKDPALWQTLQQDQEQCRQVASLRDATRTLQFKIQNSCIKYPTDKSGGLN